ncbi:Tm-1-like ATP-binding domain-containing protein [Chloroflexota bacterium]
MNKIVILGTLDTKGEQLRYLKEKVEARGHKAIIMDLSMGGIPPFEAEVTPAEIASLAGKKIEHLRSSKDRAIVIEAMTSGAKQKALDLFSQGELDGIVALGGTTIAFIGSDVMQQLPLGIPKVIAVPDIMASFVEAWFDAMDVMVMQMIVEMTSINDLVKGAIEFVAGAISGMVEVRPYAPLCLPYPSVAITEYGFSQQCARQVEKLLKENGYNVSSYHAQGVSDKAMVKLISQGYYDGVIDITPGGLIEEIFQGNRAAGMGRLNAAARRIPQVLAPSGVNITGCGPTRNNREKYASRSRILKVDELRWFTRYSAEELKIGAKVYAEELNKAKKPVKILIPLRGWNSVDREGSVLYDPEEDKVFVEELKKHLRPEIEVQEVDCNLEDPEFAQALVDSFDEIFQRERGGT